MSMEVSRVDEEICITLQSIARAHGKMGEMLNRYDEALEYLYQAKKITTENIGYENIVIASICHNIGSINRYWFDQLVEIFREKRR